MHKLICLPVLLFTAQHLLSAQTVVQGKVIDASSHQPVQGVTITWADRSVAVITRENGTFRLTAANLKDSLRASCIGYQSWQKAVNGPYMTISLEPSFASLDEIITSGNREVQRRTEVPAAVSVISKTMINDTRATRLDMLINKIPGVFMVDLGNEQHSMSIRQPLGYNNLFLYLEDGIPIRTVGDFNHNALIEINQASLERIEVVKGPSSSSYGSEAVGGAINFITQAPSPFLSGKIQAEAGTRGYRRTDFSISNTCKKLGVYAGGYYASQNQPADQHNDFSKTALTVRADYAFSDKLKWVTVADYLRYHTDQKGGLDSTHFYRKDYGSIYRFTYRKVDALRLRSTISREWNDNNKTSFTLFYRHSAIGQNPFYYIANVPGNPAKANGQVNEDAFHSYGTVIQHVKQLPAIKAQWITGVSADYSPAGYYARYIDIDRDNTGVYRRYTLTDSLLTDYQANLLNTAAYTQLEYRPVARLKVVASARYDRLEYTFSNHLPPGAYSGAPDATDHYDRFTPKVGVTYNFGRNTGLYLNYSAGFAPPNITDLYTGVKVPVLKPSSYNNYEAGGWMAFAGTKGYVDVSVYRLDGTNEIVNVRLPDGTYANQNAGMCTHMERICPR